MVRYLGHLGDDPRCYHADSSILSSSNDIRTVSTASFNLVAIFLRWHKALSLDSEMESILLQHLCGLLRRVALRNVERLASF